MVNDSGQLFTIEGVASGLIMILTVYFVVNATSVYTAGDAHISDMQLEVLGNDALKMMDTPANWSVLKTPLQAIVENDQRDTFRTMFLNYTANRSLAEPDHINFVANYTCRAVADDSTGSYALSASRNLTGGEHPVRATKWVIVNKKVCGSNVLQDRAVLVEVLLWRD
jgi:hypothetical protein